MLQVGLYINSAYTDSDGVVQDVWTRADIEDGVNIVLNDSIKDARDVGKVFTAFTNQFRLPASKTNNKIFRYFHDHAVQVGFDSRRKHSAYLTLNGAEFKRGYIKLNEVELKDNMPLWYNIEFFGEISSLKDILGASMLEDLTSLSKYNHEYNIDNVKDGFEAGLALDSPFAKGGLVRDVDGDIKYALISHTRLFEYDEQGYHRILSQEERDAAYSVTSADRLSYADLKPSLRVTRIFDAIEDTFPTIEFDKSWINSSTINDLFVWLHREKGYITYGEDIENLNFYGNLKDGNGEYEYDLASGDTELRPLSTYNIGGVGQFYSGTFSVTSTGSGDMSASVILLLNNTPYSVQQVTGTGTIDIEFTLPTLPSGSWEVITQVYADNTVSSVTPTIELTRSTFTSGGTTVTTSNYELGTLSLTQDILVPLLLPKKKIIDFLSDLFKMFNLVAHEVYETDGSYKIKIINLDDYYLSGRAYDITKYIDISESSVGRISPYGAISMTYPEPKTFLAINRNQIVKQEFGNAYFNVANFSQGANTGETDLLFDGGEYNIEPKVEKMLYERLERVDNDQLTRIQQGLFVNDNKQNIPEPEIGEMLLHYIHNEFIGVNTIKWDDGTQTTTRYNRPSNVNYNSGNETLHFNQEYDEWTRTENPNSLFDIYYRKYIEGIYSPYARRVNVKCYLPSAILQKVGLMDTIKIENIYFIIERIKTNLINGKTMLSLLRITDVEQVYRVPSEYDIVWETEEDFWDSNGLYWEEVPNTQGYADPDYVETDYWI